MVDVLIGREEKKDQPRLALNNNGEIKFYGNPGSVPKSVSRQHCRLVINDDASMSITDVTDNNFMFINGLECKKRSCITIDDVVELGPDRYRVNLAAIVQAYAAQQTYSITHLESIYSKYTEDRMNIDVQQGKLNALSSLPGIISMSSIGLAVFVEPVRIFAIIIAVITAIVFAVIRMHNASSVPAKKKALDDKFHDDYICPNPFCQHFLGPMQYKDLQKLHNCPYCKSKWKE